MYLCRQQIQWAKIGKTVQQKKWVNTFYFGTSNVYHSQEPLQSPFFAADFIIRCEMNGLSLSHFPLQPVQLVHLTSHNNVSCLYLCETDLASCLWCIQIVFTIFSSNFSPLYARLFLFVCIKKRSCPLLNWTSYIVHMYYHYYFLSLFFHLGGIFAGTFKTSAECKYFFQKLLCSPLLYVGKWAKGY